MQYTVHLTLKVQSFSVIRPLHEVLCLVDDWQQCKNLMVLFPRVALGVDKYDVKYS